MSDLPKALSESVLRIGAKSIKVFQLDNGERVMDRDDVESFFYDGGEQERLVDALALDHAVNTVNELMKEVELFAEIARIESPTTQLGGWDWKGIHERLAALVARIREQNRE